MDYEELRDQIAMRAMAAIIAKHPPFKQMEGQEKPSQYLFVARGAYLYADAMIAARKAK